MVNGEKDWGLGIRGWGLGTWNLELGTELRMVKKIGDFGVFWLGHRSLDIGLQTMCFEFPNPRIIFFTFIIFS